MKIIFSMTLILLSMNLAYAGEWDFVELSDNFQIFDEKNTREEKGDIVREWSTISWLGNNAITLKGHQLQSVRVWNQYDCEKRRAKRIGLFGYTEKLKKGEPIYGDSQVSTWQTLPKGSIIEGMWNVACRG